LFSKVLNERLIQHLEDCSSLHESQNGFRPARNCVEHIFSLSQVVQGRIREKKLTFACFFDVRKAFDSVWLAGLFCKCSHKGIRGRILRVLQDMYRKSESCVLVGGHKSARFKVAQGVAQGCPLSTTLFAIFVDDLLHELHARGVGIPVQDSVVSSFMFADDLVVVAESQQNLQLLITAVGLWLNKWRLRANVGKSAVMMFGALSDAPPQHAFDLGGVALPIVSQYRYLGVQLASDGKWDKHIAQVVISGKKRVGRVYKLLKQSPLPIRVKVSLLKALVRPVLEYASEVWHCNAAQSKLLEALQLKAAKLLLRCRKTASSSVVRGDLGLQALEERRDAAKLRFDCRLHNMPDGRLPKLVLGHQWIPRRLGRRTPLWVESVDKIWSSLGANRAGVIGALPHLMRRRIDELLQMRSDQQLQRAARGSPTTRLYCKILEHEGGPALKFYSAGSSRAPAVLHRFHLRAGCAGLQAEVAKRSGACDDGMHASAECPLCQAHVEDVVHVMAECPAHVDMRAVVVSKLQELDAGLGAMFAASAPIDQAAMLLCDSLWGDQSEKNIAWRQACDNFIVGVMQCRLQANTERE
jgi:hypothetical protein